MSRSALVHILFYPSSDFVFQTVSTLSIHVLLMSLTFVQLVVAVVVDVVVFAVVVDVVQPVSCVVDLSKKLYF